MNLLVSLAASLALFVSSNPALAGSSKDAHHTPPKVSKTFESMKALVGTWEGVTKMDGKDTPVQVTYSLTSGGSTLVETMAPGTPNEMITVYANRGQDVNATHYCMLGNQPVMKLKKATDSSFEFEMVGTQGISDKNEMHMHGVTLTLAGGDRLKQEWSNFMNGKKGDHAVFEFTKKK